MFQVAASDVMFLTHENRTSAKTLIGLLPTSIDSDAKRLGIGAILLGRTQSPSLCLCGTSPERPAWKRIIQFAKFMEDSVVATSTVGTRHRLTVFLIKEGYDKIDAFLSVGSLKALPVSSADADGTLFFKSGFESQPSWAAIFAEVPNFNPKSMVNRGSRALYVTQIKDRWFCFTFGYTRHLITESAIERNFGLIVALNLGDPSAFKAIDKTNISHVSLQSREQASRDVGFEGFELDTDIDLLKSITAKSPEVDGKEQETYSGRDDADNPQDRVEGLRRAAILSWIEFDRSFSHAEIFLSSELATRIRNYGDAIADARVSFEQSRRDLDTDTDFDVRLAPLGRALGVLSNLRTDVRPLLVNEIRSALGTNRLDH